VLIEKYGFWIIYDDNSRLDSKLDSILRNGVWCWKSTRSKNLVDIQCCLLEVYIGPVDKPVWTIARKGSYVNSDT